MNFEEDAHYRIQNEELPENWGSQGYEQINQNDFNSQENWIEQNNVVSKQNALTGKQSPINDPKNNIEIEDNNKQVMIHVDRFSNRIIENILNDEKATTSLKKKHVRQQPTIQVNRYQQQPEQPMQQQNHIALGPQFLSPTNPYGKSQQQQQQPGNTLKTNSQTQSQNHDADLSLSQSFLTAQIQQSQGTQHQTPGNQSFQTPGHLTKDKDTTHPYQNSFNTRQRAVDNFSFLPQPNSNIVIEDEMSQIEPKVQAQQSDSMQYFEINREDQGVDSMKLQDRSLGFSSDQDMAFKKSVQKVDKSLQNLNPMQIEELLVPQQQNRSSVEPTTFKMDHYDHLPDDSTVVIDNLQGSSYLDVSYKFPPGQPILDSVELLKDSMQMQSTIQQSTIKRDFNSIQKKDFNQTIQMARKSGLIGNIYKGAGTGQTPWTKQSPQNPQIEWLNKVQTSMKKDIESSKKNKVKTITYSGQKDKSIEFKTLVSNGKIPEPLSYINSNEKFLRQPKSPSSQSGTFSVKHIFGEPSLSKSKAQKGIEAIRHSRSMTKEYFSSAQYNTQKQPNRMINLDQYKQTEQKKPLDIVNEIMQKNVKQEFALSRSNKKSSHKKSIQKSQKVSVVEIGHFIEDEEEQCDLDETELDDEAHDAVKWKMEQDFDVKSGGGMGQQTMLLNNLPKPGIEIGLDIRNMTSMGNHNLNETAILQDIQMPGDAPPPPINKQSVFYRRRHKKNFSMHIVGNVSNQLLNQTAIISHNESQGGHHVRTGSANGFSSEVQTNLNQTYNVIAAPLPQQYSTHKKEIQDNSENPSPSSTVKLMGVTPNLNFCPSKVDSSTLLHNSANQSMISRKKSMKSRSPSTNQRSLFSANSAHNRLYSLGMQKQLRRQQQPIYSKENTNEVQQKTDQYQKNLLKRMNSFDISSANKASQNLQANKKASRNIKKSISGMSVQQPQKSNQKQSPQWQFRSYNTRQKEDSLQKSQGKANGGNREYKYGPDLDSSIKQKKHLTPQDFSHKYDELMSKKHRTQQKVAMMVQQKKENEDKFINSQINPALARKVSKSREKEALARFNNYEQDHKAKMKLLKQKKDEQEAEMLKKLFKPKIIKNYKSSAASTQDANRRKFAKSVNTYNYNMSRNECTSTHQAHSMNQGAPDHLSIDFIHKLNEENTVESQLNLTTMIPQRKKKTKYNHNHAISFGESEINKTSDHGNNLDHNQSKTFDLRCNLQSSVGQKSQFNPPPNKLGISAQQSLASNTLDAMDLDSEAFDRLESFYGKMRKPSIQSSSKQNKQGGSKNPFMSQKQHPVPKLDLDNLKSQQSFMPSLPQNQSHSNTTNTYPNAHSTSLCQNNQMPQATTTGHQISYQDSQMIAFKFDEQCKIEEEYEDSPNGGVNLKEYSESYNMYDNIKEFAIKPPGTGGEDSCIEFNIDYDQDQSHTADRQQNAMVNDQDNQPNRQSGSGCQTSDDEEESECCTDDIDEHASEKVSLKNIDMKIKLDLENNTGINHALNNSRYDDSQQFKCKNAKAQSALSKQQNKPPQGPMKPQQSKEQKQQAQASQIMSLRTKNSVFKSNKVSLTMKDLSMVGLNIRKIEKQQGDNLMKYEMSQSEIQASSCSMRQLKKV